MIHCRTLGPVEITVPGSETPPELLWRKNLALLIYLARSPTRGRTRDHLIGLLWPDKPESAARHSLREATRVLRASLGEEGIETEGDQVRLTGDRLQLDTEVFERAVESGDWANAAMLVRGAYLEGFSVPESSPFEDWMTSERLLWRQRSVDALARYAELLLTTGDLSGALDQAHRAVAVDPLSGPAVRAAMRACALRGDSAAAVAYFDDFQARLRDAAGAAPDGSTVTLLERVRRERVWKLPAYVRTAAGRGATSRRVPLFGRDAELQQLVRAVRASVEHRRAGVVVIEGDPGMGKTRLVEELAARARLEGTDVVMTRAVPGDLESPLSAVVGLARGGLLDASGLATAQPPALATLAAQVPEWAERFPAAAREPSPWPITAAWAEIVRAVTNERPLLLIVDDSQWLDGESFRVLDAMLRDLVATPLCLLLPSSGYPRPPEMDEIRSRIGRDLPGATVRLESLARDGLERLVRWGFPSYSDEQVERLARRLLADSAGVPLLATELLNAVSLGLDLQAGTGVWPSPLRTLDHTLPSDLPDTMVAAIRVNFRRLGTSAQQVLVAAAILDERVTTELLARATGLLPDEVNGSLDELEWQRWLVAEGRGYSFLARIVRDVIERDMVTEGQRQRIRDAAAG